MKETLKPRRGRPRKIDVAKKQSVSVEKKDYTYHAIWLLVIYHIFTLILIGQTFKLVFDTMFELAK